MKSQKRKSCTNWLNRHATSIPKAEGRAMVEPLENRMLLSAADASLTVAMMLRPTAHPAAAPVSAHNSHLSKPASKHAGKAALIRAGKIKAHAALMVSRPTMKAGNTVGSVSNPAPVADSIAPSQLRQAYGFNSVLPDGTTPTGAGETIALIDGGHDPAIQNDLHVFDQQYFGGVDPSFTQVNLGSSTATAGDPVETALDVEWAHAMAPQANILLVEAASMQWTDLLTAVDKAVSLGAQVVSMSWGSADYSSESLNDSHFTAPNVTFVACSGDFGSPGWYPSASPNVLSVGGTSVLLDVNNNVSNEVGWVDVGNSSGGGVSAYEPRPAYQPATYSNGTTTGIALTGRGVPDVSYDADADNGVAVYNSAVGAGWERVGGTSCGAPQWAAIIALADQIRGQRGLAALGTADVHSAIYANPGDFRDIIAGTTTGSPNYTAGPGYDLVTGLGSPQVPLAISTLTGPTNSIAATPPGLWAIPGDGQVNLNWGGSIGANAYNVYRSTDGITFTLDATVSGTRFVDVGLTNGASYSYEITAANAAGESAAGEIISATPQIPPVAPTNLSAMPSRTSSTVSLQWTASPGVTQYVVERAKFADGPWVAIATDVQGTSFNDIDATYGHTYYYAVSALTAAGQESDSSNVASATVIPAAPTNLTATAGNAQATLSWSASNGATSYNILRSTTNGGPYTLIATGITATSYVNSKLTNGTTYYYVVQAVDASGPSANSNQASVTPKHGK